jgi:hypothetical protein
MWFLITLVDVTGLRGHTWSYLKLSLTEFEPLLLGRWLRIRWFFSIWHWLHCKWNTRVLYLTFSLNSFIQQSV